MKRVLLVLSQMPHDPASGAARSMRTMCEMLASFPARFRVRAVVASATEHGAPGPPEEALRAAGIDPLIEPPRSAGEGVPARPRLLRFESAGVGYAMLDTGADLVHLWNPETHAAFDELVASEAAAFRPDIVLTFGGQPAETARRRNLRDRGAAIVFGLRNHGYLVPGAFRDVDFIITPSRFLSEVYRDAMGLESTPLPVPINEAEVVADQREPVFFTFINPSPDKGVFFFARLAEVVCARRPDIHFMVVESRGTSGVLVAAGLAGGFDLRRHKSILCSPGVSEPRHIFAATRVLLVPSVWDEPSGRVAGEAMINGVPPIVSDRGGLPETVGTRGFVLPLPGTLLRTTTTPVTAAAVEPWAGLVERLADDDLYYERARASARAGGEQLRFAALAPRYAEVFESVRRGPEHTQGPGIEKASAGAPPPG
ncbi:MAG: glycosyltransferase [Planctomycetes bacterium]|nr:glycosyltransferase [Planctomycetota bacterium]